MQPRLASARRIASHGSRPQKTRTRGGNVTSCSPARHKAAGAPHRVRHGRLKAGFERVWHAATQITVCFHQRGTQRLNWTPGCQIGQAILAIFRQ
eukprot:156212-Rhodomonas_salina.2